MRKKHAEDQIRDIRIEYCTEYDEIKFKIKADQCIFFETKSIQC